MSALSGDAHEANGRPGPKRGFMSGLLFGLGLTCALAVVAPNQAHATFAATLPAGLAAGSHYRLVFVTSATTSAISTSIGTYNSFVTSAGSNVTSSSGAALSTTWSAIGSTSAVSAITNIACTPTCASDPIYTLNGTQVATSTADLFDGAINTAINLTEQGTTISNAQVWTGSRSSGASFTGNELGATNPVFGNDGLTNSQWMAQSTSAPNTALYRLYAISGDLIVPASIATTAVVPEPASLSLLILGGIGAASISRRTRRRAV